MNKQQFIDKYFDSLILFSEKEKESCFEKYRVFCNNCIGIFYDRILTVEIEEQFDYYLYLHSDTIAGPVFHFKEIKQTKYENENKRTFNVFEFVDDFISYLEELDKDRIKLWRTTIENILHGIDEPYNRIERRDIFSIKEIKDENFYPGYKDRNVWIWWNTTGSRIVFIFGIGTF